MRFYGPEWRLLAEAPLTQLMVDMDNRGKTKSGVLARVWVK